MTDDVQAFAEGAAGADDPKYNAQECADVKAWQKRIDDSRRFDEAARKQYALNRRYAKGDAGAYKIKIPIASSYVDILNSLLYAKNPDLDVQPAEATTPPPMQDIIEMAREKIGADPETHQIMEQVGVAATQKATAAMNQALALAPSAAMDPLAKAKIAQASVDPNQQPEAIGEQAAQAWLNATIQEEAKKIMEPPRKRLNDAKQFSKTIQVVVARLWAKGALKPKTNQQLRSTLSVGPGWQKATWQERRGQDPVTLKAIQDAQDQLALLDAAQEQLAEGMVSDKDAKRAEIEQRIEGLTAKVEIILARGMAFDFVLAEDVQVAPGIALENYLDAPWIAHRVFMPTKSAKAKYPRIAEEIGKANVYHERKLQDPADRRDVGDAVTNIDAKEADSFVSGTTSNGSAKDDLSPHVCVWEVQSKSLGMAITLVEGVDKYAVAPYAPDPGTTRFYSLFLLAMLWVDGQRHPQSLIERSMSLLDEANRLHSNRAEHRKRCMPKTGFDSSGLEPEEARKIEKATTGEMVGIKPMVPGTKIADLLAPIQYPRIDEALYDDRVVMAKLEIIWAIQEALASSINVEKTATEAEIQQTGTNARTSQKRGVIDEMMDDMAQYTTEVALQKLTHDDVVKIAGPWAFWPEGLTVQDMDSLVTVKIKAGSSGKPNTSAQQQAWAAIFPLLKDTLLQIGQLRGSLPTDIADGLEELIAETVARAGEQFDPSRFIPAAPSNEPGSMPTQPGAQQQPGQPPPGQQPPQPGQPPSQGPQPIPQAPPPNQLPVPNNVHTPAQLNGAHA